MQELYELVIHVSLRVIGVKISLVFLSGFKIAPKMVSEGEWSQKLRHRAEKNQTELFFENAFTTLEEITGIQSIVIRATSTNKIDKTSMA